MLSAYNAPTKFDDVGPGPGEDGHVRFCASTLVSLIDKYECKSRISQLVPKRLLIARDVFCAAHDPTNMLFSPAAERIRKSDIVLSNSGRNESAKVWKCSVRPKRRAPGHDLYAILTQCAWGLPRVMTLPPYPEDCVANSTSGARLIMRGGGAGLARISPASECVYTKMTAVGIAQLRIRNSQTFLLEMRQMPAPLSSPRNPWTTS